VKAGMKNDVDFTLSFNEFEDLYFKLYYKPSKEVEGVSNSSISVYRNFRNNKYTVSIELHYEEWFFKYESVFSKSSNALVKDLVMNLSKVEEFLSKYVRHSLKNVLTFGELVTLLTLPRVLNFVKTHLLEYMSKLEKPLSNVVDRGIKFCNIVLKKLELDYIVKAIDSSSNLYEIDLVTFDELGKTVIQVETSVVESFLYGYKKVFEFEVTSHTFSKEVDKESSSYDLSTEIRVSFSHEVSSILDRAIFIEVKFSEEKVRDFVKHFHKTLEGTLILFQLNEMLRKLGEVEHVL